MTYTKTPPFAAPYVRDAVTQIDGTAYAQSNCVIVCTKVLINSSSLGWYDPSASYLRTISGDTSGGITYDTAIKIADQASHGEVQLQRLYWAPEDSTTSTLRNVLRTKRITAVSIDCSVTVNTPYHTGNYTGGHSVIAGYVPWFDSAGVERVWVMDPGKGDAYVRWEAWPIKLLIKAAHARTGGNTIHLLFSRDLTGVNRTAKTTGPIRKAATVTAAQVGTVTEGHVYTVATTYRSGFYQTPNGHPARGWSQLGPGKFVSGAQLR